MLVRWVPASHESDEREIQRIRIVLEGATEAHLRIGVPRLVDEDRSLLGWSHAEIALARVDEPDLPQPISGRHWISFLWEDDSRRIDVAFRDFTLSHSQSPDLGPESP